MQRSASIAKRALACSRSRQNEYAKNFGYEQVSPESRQNRVNEVFSSVASKYDIMNDLMSLATHRLWKDYFVARLNPQPNWSIIDGAGGTGDIAFRCHDYLRLNTHAISAHMAGSSLVAGNTTIPIGKPLFTVGKCLDHFGLLKSVNGVVSKIPMFGESFRLPVDKALNVTVYDINQEMLDVGADRAVKQYKFKKFEDDYDNEVVFCRDEQEISFKQVNLEHLAEREPENSRDAFTIAFGIRNCSDIPKVIEQAYTVLKPGGKFMVLEFSKVAAEPLKTIYDQYSMKMIPVMGQLVAGDYKSYQYLVESIRKFPDQENFADMIRQGGFEKVSYENLTGGVVAIHTGYKPMIGDEEMSN